MLRTNVIDLIVKLALREDVGTRDITTSSIIPKNSIVKAEIEAQASGILCGIEIAELVFRYVDENVRFLPVGKDGDSLEPGQEIAYIEGSAASVLIAERTALNFLTHLSGIATYTRQFVEKVRGTQTKILDTRKTTPNLRVLEKYAVKTGGGTNHRAGLYDQILIKDNHLKILRNEKIVDIVALAHKQAQKNIPIGIEVKNFKELEEALKTHATYILLDNMSPEKVRECIQIRTASGKKTPFEVSGGITLENVRSYAELGVERISVGSLTHTAPALNISLDIVG